MKQILADKIARAENAFRAWKNVSVAEKQKHLRRLAELLNMNKQKYGEMITSEMNKPISQAIGEIEKCAGMTLYYADAENVLAPEVVETGHSLSVIHHEPMGVVLGIMPWNYPFWQVLRFAVPAILAGNTVVLKHASICLGSGDAIEALFLDAGFPEGIFQHLVISHDEVEELISNPVIKGVSLTGSEAAGRKIAETAGRNLKKCVLELGGSDAFIVLDDADIDKAAVDAVQARLQNTGQTCVAGKRFIIQSSIYEEFVAKFIAAYKKNHPSDPRDKDTVLGSMAREDLADGLTEQYQKAIENGAQPLVALTRVGSSGFEPGLIEVNASNPVLGEELFGPLGMVLKADTDEEILRLANDTMFGLANAVYTKNRGRAMYFATNLESGSVAVNQVFRSDWRMPFGGRKNSGYGVELSLYALREFTILKSIIGEI